jgi:hypothetical protein
MASYLSPGLTIGPDPVVPKYGAPLDQLPTPLATDESVVAAYQALMQYIATGDANKGVFQRNLTDNLAQTQKNRLKAVLQSHQSLADRGLLNSGIALGQEADVGTQYDALAAGYQNQYTDQVGAIDRNTTGLRTAYDNSQDVASGKYTAAQAKAAADAMAAQDAAAAQQQQIANMIAALTPPPLTQQAAIPNYTPPAQAPYIPPAPKPKPAPKPSGTTGALKQSIYGGPQ